MNNSQILANRFREVILNGTWIANTNFYNQINLLDFEIAIKKIDNLNTIADLSQHIHYYINGINNAFLTGNLEIRDQFSFDFPQITSQEQWQLFLKIFWKDASLFATLTEQLSDDKLNEDFIDKKYGNYARNINAMIEHSYYHLGQISLLLKIINK